MSVLFKTMSVSRFAVAAVMAAGGCGRCVRAEATTLGFSCITNNSASSCAIGQSQLTAELTTLGGGRSSSCSRTPARQLVGNADLLRSAEPDADEPQLEPDVIVERRQLPHARLEPQPPRGNGISFQATNGYGSRPPVALNGINPNEWLKLVFTLNSGSTSPAC
jgi:hypothetical protein